MTDHDNSPAADAPAAAGESSQAALAEPSRSVEIVAGVVALIIFGGLIVLSNQIELRQESAGIDPRWWPRLLGFVGAALSIVLLFIAVTREIPRGDVEAPTRNGVFRLGACLLLTPVFIVGWQLVGFPVATVVYTAALLYVFGARGWKGLVFYPVGVTAFLYLLFDTLLRVPL